MLRSLRLLEYMFLGTLLIYSLLFLLYLDHSGSLISRVAILEFRAKMISLVASCSSQMSPSVSCQEKGSRNKRKFRADPPLCEPNKITPTPQLGCLNFEFSAEKLEITPGHGQVATCLCGISQNQYDRLKPGLGLYSPGTSKVGLRRSKERPKTDEVFYANWSDFIETQLEELVLSNLHTILKSAIKKIVAYGYIEEVATIAILRPGICYGCKDTVSNIVDNTLAFLRNGQEIDTPREHYFEDIVQLEKYLLAELVCVLREVRPFFSIGDAMWCLLICDMNVSHACAMDCEPLCSLSGNNTSDGGSSGQAGIKVPELSLLRPSKSTPTSSHNSQSKKPFVTGIPNLNNLNSQIIHGTSENEGTSCGSNCIGKTFNTAGTSQFSLKEEKFGTDRKVHSGSTKKDYVLQHRSFHVEKSNRYYGSKGSSRRKKPNGLTQDKVNCNFSCNPGTSTHTAFSLDSSSESFSNSTNTSNAVHATNTIPAFCSPASSSATSTNLSLTLSSKIKPSMEPVCDNNEAPNSSYMGISYNKSSRQWIPHDGKDDMILKLVPRLQQLQNQIQEWTEWANQRVMQVARRLSKEKAELQTLRQEKEEVERLKKEKQSLEENTLKKLYEMENALCKVSGQVERATATVQKLEVEKTALRKEMEAAKLRATETAARCQEVSRKERKTQTKFQSWEKQKSLFQEELMIEKRKLAQLRQELEQARMQQEQVVGRWQQERMANEELILQSSCIRKEREEIEESWKSKEEMIKLKVERNVQRYRDDIDKVEKEIGQLRLKSESSKMVALRMGIDGRDGNRGLDKKNGTTEKEHGACFISELVIDESATGGLKRERECVMCLSEEMSVVFLPCAHQVVCTTCNQLHEKQGMQHCPSCRTPIHHRIAVCFPPT
ncbi:hypothetical protein VNO78_22629 [Psophocarpus tetragonolobus]|uniref:RING-type domain-containing protein n=1 Tax=Psophocarpus tetragonolobus TaxID=3891 RepID=A0AAN9S519_PSOTE